MSELIKYDSIEDSWLGVDTGNPILWEKINPLLVDDEPFFRENPHLHIIDRLADPNYLAYTVWILFGVKLMPFQAAILAEMWVRPFPMLIMTRGGSKTYSMALYAMLKALLIPNYKVVIVGAAFRQSRLVFEYCEKFYQQGTMFRTLLDAHSGPKTAIDKCVFYINSSTITAVPIGPGGQKIRGLRANCIIADEFDAQDKDVFETVVVPFTAVSQDPAEASIKRMRNNKLKTMGIDLDNGAVDRHSNQIIISGTSGYFFGPLYEYYNKYKKIIQSKGDPRKLEDALGGEPHDSFNWRDYSIIRIPYDLLPEGFLDPKAIARAKATMNTTIFNMEYGATFTEDSDGFFKRSVIEGCVASNKNVERANWIPWCSNPFEPRQLGDPTRQYVMGIDPASERDNLAISILELHSEHARLVHVWTTNKDDFRERQRRGYTKEIAYNAFVARKVRDLMKTFNCLRIGIDAQGGGYALMEALGDANTLQPGEESYWEIIDYDNPKESDRYSGLHIIEKVQFGNYEWLYTANYALLKDMESKKLLLPRFDPVSIDLAIIEDKSRVAAMKKENPQKSFVMMDTMEDLFLEIEDLKDELTSIVVRMAGTGVNGRLRWDVPEVILEGNKKGRSRKDRYSSLLIANHLARTVYREPPKSKNLYVQGGLVQEFSSNKKSGGELYSGPEWFTKKANSWR